MTRVVPLVPNAETIEAMKAARRGELVTAGRSSGALIASLNEDDDGVVRCLADTNRKRPAPKG